MGKWMEEDEVYQELWDKCAEALAKMGDMKSFTALASSNPSIYLGAYLANEVAEKDIERRLFIIIHEVKLSFALMKSLFEDKWYRLMSMDETITRVAFLYTLILRYSRSRGSKVDMNKFFWKVMRNEMIGSSKYQENEDG